MARIGQYDTDGWRVVWEFRLPEATVLLNKWQRMHWAERKKYTTRLAWLVMIATRDQPRHTLQAAWVHVERGSYGILPDPDGLIGGLKPLLDVLTLPKGNKLHGLGLIENDDPRALQRLTAHSVKAPKGAGYSLVTIFRKDEP